MSVFFEQLRAQQEYLTGLRRAFHQHPELALQEFWTAEAIERELAWFACQRHLDAPDIEAVFPTLKGSIDHALARLMRHEEQAETRSQ